MSDSIAEPIYDLHAHTRVSRCSDDDWTVDRAIDRAMEVGLAGLAITDHLMPYTDFGELLDSNHRFIAHGRGRGYPVWSSVEVEVFNDRGDLNMSSAQAEQLDFVMAAWGHVHQKHVELPAGRTLGALFDFLHKVALALCEDTRVKVIAHPWQTPSRWSEQWGFPAYGAGDVPEGMLAELGRAALATETVLELNMAHVGKPDKEASELFEKQQRLLRVCRPLGCTFSIGGDSHRAPDMLRAPRFAPFLSAVGLAAGDIWAPALPV